MKHSKNILYIFLIFFYSSISNSSSIVYIDIDYIIANSLIGKSATNQIDNKKKKIRK